MTFTTAAFDRSSSWWFGVSPTKRLGRVLLHLSYSTTPSHRRLHDTMPGSAVSNGNQSTTTGNGLLAGDHHRISGDRPIAARSGHAERVRVATVVRRKV